MSGGGWNWVGDSDGGSGGWRKTPEGAGTVNEVEGP